MKIQISCRHRPLLKTSTCETMEDRCATAGKAEFKGSLDVTFSGARTVMGLIPKNSRSGLVLKLVLPQILSFC